MCGSVFMRMPVLWRPEEGVGCPGAGVTGGCEVLGSASAEQAVTSPASPFNNDEHYLLYTNEQQSQALQP